MTTYAELTQQILDYTETDDNVLTSTINNDNASERPADSLDAIALICEPFANLMDNLLISSVFVFNH